MPDDAPAPTPPLPAPPPRGWSRRVVGPFTLRHLVAVGVTLLVAAGLLTLLSTPLSPAPDGAVPRPGSSFVIVGERTDGLVVGAPAPPLAGMRDGVPVPLLDLDGVPIDLADLRGRVVWVNFWASWCPPCQEETPVLRALDTTHRDRGLTIVGVSVQETEPEDIRRYAQTYDLRYRIGFDGTSEVFRAWRGFGLPTQVFLDRDGIVRVLHYGPLDLVGATATVETLLAAPHGSPAPGTPGPAASAPPIPASPGG